MSGKGSRRRREDTAAVEANWERAFGKKAEANSTVIPFFWGGPVGEPLQWLGLPPLGECCDQVTIGKQERTPQAVFNGEVEGDTQGPARQGTPVQVLPGSRQDHSSDGV